MQYPLLNLLSSALSSQKAGVKFRIKSFRYTNVLSVFKYQIKISKIQNNKISRGNFAIEFE